MSRTLLNAARRTLLPAALLTAALLTTPGVFGQTAQYTWRNVQVVGGGFVPGIVFSQTEPNLVYARTDIGGAYRLDPSTNRWVPLLDSISWDDWNLTGGGKTWTASAGIPAGARVASDRVNPNKFYGFKSGTFYLSTDGGKTFAATAAAGLPAAGNVRFKAVPGREGDIWLAGGSEDGGVYGLWHSTNSGASFTKLSNVEEADNIGFGKAAAGQTYPALYAVSQVAGLRGIFRSVDAGQSWVRINDDQHQWGRAGDTAITGDPRVYGRVYVGTNGRGIIYGDGQ